MKDTQTTYKNHRAAQKRPRQSSICLLRPFRTECRRGPSPCRPGYQQLVGRGGTDGHENKWRQNSKCLCSLRRSSGSIRQTRAGDSNRKGKVGVLSGGSVGDRGACAQTSLIHSIYQPSHPYRGQGIPFHPKKLSHYDLPPRNQRDPGCAA